MSDFLGDWHALLALVLAGFLPNEIWRSLGLWLGSGVDEGSEFLVWVRSVATAILAGVIAQILMSPPGALASVPVGCAMPQWLPVSPASSRRGARRWRGSCAANL
jgi:hypothetical protein